MKSINLNSLTIIVLLYCQDSLLDKHFADGSFAEKHHLIGRPIKSLLVINYYDMMNQYYHFLKGINYQIMDKFNNSKKVQVQ